MNVDRVNALTFTARTNISVDNDLLSKRDIKKLTKMGEKIGTNSDSIDFSVKKCDKNAVSVFYKANLNSLYNTTEASSYYFDKIENFNIFEYISKKMEYIKKVYKKIK